MLKILEESENYELQKKEFDVKTKNEVFGEKEDILLIKYMAYSSLTNRKIQYIFYGLKNRIVCISFEAYDLYESVFEKAVNEIYKSIIVK
jgi:hypothetical protein